MKQRFKELIKFLINGGICFVVEYLLTIILTDYCHIYYLLSSTIGFIISTIINYIICVLWVFNIDDKKNKKQQAIFFLTSLIALGLNQFFMYIGVSIFTINYKIMKLIATAIVTIINYFLKRKALNVTNTKKEPIE